MLVAKIGGGWQFLAVKSALCGEGGMENGTSGKNWGRAAVFGSKSALYREGGMENGTTKSLTLKKVATIALFFRPPKKVVFRGYPLF